MHIEGLNMLKLTAPHDIHFNMGALNRIALIESTNVDGFDLDDTPSLLITDQDIMISELQNAPALIEDMDKDDFKLLSELQAYSPVDAERKVEKFNSDHKDKKYKIVSYDKVGEAHEQSRISQYLLHQDADALFQTHQDADEDQKDQFVHLMVRFASGLRQQPDRLGAINAYRAQNENLRP